MELSSPLWLVALLSLPLLLAAELWTARRDRARVASLVARPLWARVVRRPAEGWRWPRLALLLLAAAALAFALAGPRWGIVRERIEREGADVVMVLDCSASMSVDDVQPSRFFLARAALASLLDRLGGDRVALVALEREAYPLVPLTLDADAVGLFLDTVEPGIVPSPGTSLGAGVARAVELFVDPDRPSKVIVLASDGEDLEGGVEEAVERARKAGVVIHTVAVGTEQGAPVPDTDASGRRTGFKKTDDGTVAVSKAAPATLARIARESGGVAVRLSSADTSLWQVAAAIEAMETRALAREYSYRRKERYQIPLAVALAALVAALLLPPPPLPRRRTAQPKPARRTAPSAGAAMVLALALASPSAVAQTAPAQPQADPPPSATSGRLLDELLLRPSRHTAKGRSSYADGDYPTALERFEAAAETRPADPRTAFNLADALYKAGRLDEAAALLRDLAARPEQPLAAAARHNLGNALFQRQDFAGAVRAYRDALALLPDELDTRRNLELALRALAEQQKQKQQQQDQQREDQDQQQEGQPQPNDQESQPQQQQSDQPPPTPEQRERERFEREAGMPKERAMQLLEALERNEKEEQRRLLAAQRAAARGGKDW